MEGPGGGSSTAALPPGGSGGGGNGGNHPHHQQQTWGATTQFYNPGDMPPGHQSQQNQQQQQQQLHLLQQQQLMQIAAAVQQSQGPQGQQLVGQPLNSMIPASQAPTLNMMIQGMANQGMGHHTLPSPSSSSAGVGPGFLFLQQPGIPAGHHQGGRDISPGSTPGLGGPQPPPAATPPALMDDRNWLQQQHQQQQQQQQQQQNMFFGAGPARHMMNMDKMSLEEQIKNQDIFALQDSGYRPSQQQQQQAQAAAQHHQEQQHILNQIQLNNEMAIARSLNQYPYAPAQSPPTMFQQPMHQPMPPRPRPEGGQDSSPNFLNEDGINFKNSNNKKEDLVIDSWTGGLTEDPPEKNTQQFYGGNQMRMLDQEKESVSGWGAPPPSNPNGWGQPPPKIGNWQQPPQSLPPSNNLFSGPPPNMNNSERGRGGGGRGGYQGRGGGNRGHNNDGGRGGNRGGRGSNLLRGRGMRGARTSALEREQEKQDGKKNAIAETIAMMNKMKMEDKERKDEHQRLEEERKARNRELGMPEPLVPLEPIVQEEEEHHNRGRRGGRDQPRFQRGGPQRGRGMRGQRGGAGIPNIIPPMFGGNPNPLAAAAPGMFFPPPGMPGFPGMEQLFLGGNPSGIPGFHPGNFPGSHGTTFFHPTLGGPPGQFGNQFRFPGAGRGLGRGFLPGGGRGFIPRGRGGRGRGGHRPQNERIVNAEEEKPPDLETIECEEKSPEELTAILPVPGSSAIPIIDPDKDIVVNPSTNIVASSEQNGEKQDDAASNDEPPKNVISGQGKPRGQLALFASQTASPSKKSSLKKSKSDLSLRDRLTQQLVSGQAECMVCLEKIRPKNATWHCDGECYQVFHIHCIKKWSKIARTEDGGWRCPGCQFVRKSPPREYRCFCGKVIDPAYERRETPHSCGEVCGKRLKSNNNEGVCPHKCVELCHPGPCPPCVASILQTCPCGKTSQTGRCGTLPICENECGRLLNCNVHNCKQICHKGACEPCNVQILQKCQCSHPTERIVECNETVETVFSCEKPCKKLLTCGNHQCTKICHNDPCEKCSRTPDVVLMCPCGKKKLDENLRKSCLDDIPTCGEVCDKILNCGPVGNNHHCREICHEGPCPKCPLTTEVRCRCGFMDKEMECSRLNSRADDALCEKQCNKKRECLRHKCGQKCCILFEHPCPLTCNRLLSCGRHRCSEPCHRGNCSSCPNVSFDELSCFCGAQVIYPPIPCGVKPPACTNICTRAHPCGHQIYHNCHNEEHCPPCTALTEKYCHGKHELRKSVACHIDGISCGRPCGKLILSCRRHTCTKACHSGECDPNCSQPCKELRSNCGHPCNSTCHDGPCPNTSCMEKVKMNCSCGNLSSVVICSNNSGLHTALLADHIRDLNNGNSSSTTSISLKDLGKRIDKLECNEECAKLERNRRVALALQIENPDLTTKLAAPKYSEFLKEVTRKDLSFATMVHEKLTELVRLAKESKHKSRSHSFDVMNREKRQFVHELTDHFGIESESYDAEPKRNVVATAFKDRVWLPSQSILDVVQGLRKAPAPIAINPTPKPTFTTLQPSSMLKIPSTTSNDDETTHKPVVDYFDFDG